MGPGPLAARGLGVAKPASPEAVSTDHLSSDGTAKPSRGKKSGGRPASPSSPKLDPAAVEAGQDVQGKPSKRQSKGKTYPRPRLKGEKESEGERVVVPKREKVAVPSIRAGLSEDLEAELEASLAGSDVESYLGGSAGLPDRKGGLEEGTRVHAQIIKIHDDTVFVSLGGPDEGAIPLEQFTSAEPAAGSSVEVLVRGLNSDDGLYACTLPGSTIDVNDWGDIDEGSIVEAVVTGHNSGGLECKIGSIAGFMPISQVTEYRVEDLSEFVDQKMVCLVMEANQRRGNLVLSRRAVLEREREEKRREQLEELQAGDVLEGTVRSVRDFGAFVDLGGVDGLIHVSRLSWERIKHPSDVIEEGQKVKVKVDKIDKQSGKIALSYRDLLENPWDAAEATFDVGSVHSGTVTRTAPFGCFVKLAAGVEGLVHISELAHHRISRVDTFVSEGDTVEVKVLSFDRDSQKIGLSIKAAQAKPAAESTPAEESEEPVREMAVPARTGPLKGGNNRDTGGERFGLRW
ncbi:MAG: S1 RNA-binding domain-containing protein [Planctomycetota bacterium]